MSVRGRRRNPAESAVVRAWDACGATLVSDLDGRPSNAKRISPKFIGTRTPVILNPVPYETCNKQPPLHMNTCTILLPDGKMARGRSREIESGHESAFPMAAYSARLKVMVKVLDFVKFGGLG